MSYRIEVLEHDGGPPWTDDVGYSRAGAWKRLQLLAREVVPGWPHPIWFKVWRMSGASRVLVYSGDLRAIL